MFASTPIGLLECLYVDVIGFGFTTLEVIAHFQKVWKPGAMVDARSIMGLFGGARAFVFNFVRPQNIP